MPPFVVYRVFYLYEQDNVCVLVNPTGADATLHTVPQKGVEAFMAKLAKGDDADARIVEMGDCQAETSEEKELGMRFATARTGEQEEMEPLTSGPDCHEFGMAVAFAGTPGDHFSAAMNSAKLSIGEADEEKQMMVDSSSAAQLLSVKVGEKDGLTHAFFSVKINMNRLTILKPCWILVNLDVAGVTLQRGIIFWQWCRGCRHNYKYCRLGATRITGKKLCPCRKCKCRYLCLLRGWWTTQSRSSSTRLWRRLRRSPSTSLSHALVVVDVLVNDNDPTAACRTIKCSCWSARTRCA